MATTNRAPPRLRNPQNAPNPPHGTAALPAKALRLENLRPPWNALSFMDCSAWASRQSTSNGEHCSLSALLPSPNSEQLELFPLRFGEVKCDVFDGHGSLARGGFHKRNHVAIERLVGMVSDCDQSTRFWINAKILKDRERWCAGWLLRGELHGIKDETLREEVKGTICTECKGCRTRPCQMCAKSEGGLHQPRDLDIIDV